MHINRILLMASAVLPVSVTSAAAEIDVVASIKPLHGLVAAVMEGAGQPSLIVEGAGSPHTYSLRPSQAADLQQADVVFWVGPQMERFLEGPIATIAEDAQAVALIEADGIATLDLREGGAFEEHSHDHGDHDHGDDHAPDDHDHGEHAHDDHDHDEHDHDDHGHEDHAHADHAHDEHSHDEHAHDDHGHDDHDHDDHAHDDHGRDHAHGETDGHIWLDPRNAQAMARAIAAALTAADPDNAELYASNASALIERLDSFETQLAERLEPFGDGRFIVFHDAYHYFEDRFGLEATGSITVNPDVVPGAERVREISDRIAELEAVCVFSEPQFEPRIVSVVTEGTDARTGVLDPLGAELPAGPDHYFNLLDAMAGSFETCLDTSS